MDGLEIAFDNVPEMSEVFAPGAPVPIVRDILADTREAVGSIQPLLSLADGYVASESAGMGPPSSDAIAETASSVEQAIEHLLRVKAALDKLQQQGSTGAQGSA